VLICCLLIEAPHLSWMPAHVEDRLAFRQSQFLGTAPIEIGRHEYMPETWPEITR
jgi:hypothetical protein